MSYNKLTNIIFYLFICWCLEKNQSTVPLELPITGDPYTEINLNLIFPKGNPVFTLRGKHLELIAPLDRDAENLSHIVFQVNILIIHKITILNIFRDILK